MGVGVVGKSDFKENPKFELDLDLGFVNLGGKLGIWEKKSVNLKNVKIGRKNWKLGNK